MIYHHIFTFLLFLYVFYDKIKLLYFRLIIFCFYRKNSSCRVIMLRGILRVFSDVFCRVPKAAERRGYEAVFGNIQTPGTFITAGAFTCHAGSYMYTGLLAAYLEARSRRLGIHPRNTVRTRWLCHDSLQAVSVRD